MRHGQKKLWNRNKVKLTYRLHGQKKSGQCLKVYLALDQKCPSFLFPWARCVGNNFSQAALQRGKDVLGYTNRPHINDNC